MAIGEKSGMEPLENSPFNKLINCRERVPVKRRKGKKKKKGGGKLSEWLQQLNLIFLALFGVCGGWGWDVWIPAMTPVGLGLGRPYFQGGTSSLSNN